MVIEMADGGDLMELYKEKRGQKYSFKLGLKVLVGAARGLAHMHTMPTPCVHRDVKSSNIMVMKDGAGKLGDCGASRRIDLNSTMTRTGTALWAAPELLAGKRYCEDVDTYSLGAVMYEIVACDIPYAEVIAGFKREKVKGNKAQLMREVAAGLRRPDLKEKVEKCRQYRVSGAFKKRRFSIRNADVIEATRPISLSLFFLICPSFTMRTSLPTLRQI